VGKSRELRGRARPAMAGLRASKPLGVEVSISARSDRGVGEFIHEALLYADDEEFLGATLPPIREALEDAYPELALRWTASGDMSRGEVEDFFKVEYGLSATSAGPAAKLFVDLMREAEGRDRGDTASGRRGGAVATASLGPVHRAAPAPPPAPAPPLSDVRLAALDAIKSSLRIDINSDWDQDRIRLVFDRMERLVDRILERA